MVDNETDEDLAQAPDSETNQGASDVRKGAFGAMKGASGDDDTCQEGA